jgi:hypothetical protein
MEWHEGGPRVEPTDRLFQRGMLRIRTISEAQAQGYTLGATYPFLRSDR